MKDKIAILAVLVNILLAVGKITVGFFSNSASVMAEGIHSSVDVVASFIGWVGVRLGKKPVDKEHPYGHQKFEVMAGVLITIILFATGIEIMFEAYKGFLRHEHAEIGFLALSVMLFSALVNEIMARIKIYYGKKYNAVALISDGVHSRVDVWASVAVFVGLLLYPYWNYIDSVLAMFVGLYIIKESISMGKEMTDSLLDVSAGDEIENQIKDILKKQNIELQDLKTQKRGLLATANIKIVLPKNLSVDEATKITRSLKDMLLSEVEPLEYVVIQIESDDEIHSENYYRSKDPIFHFGVKNRFHWSSQIKKDGEGPGGFCVCPVCGHREVHKKGIPCSTLKCPKCNEGLVRV